MQSTYEQALTQILKDEGGYTNDPKDPGGPTNWGITLQDARQYWKSDATAEDVKHMDVSVAKEIYRNHYANPIQYDNLPAGVDYAVLDYGINSGISRAVRTLQIIVNAHIDGVMGPDTLSDTDKMNPEVIINEFYAHRLAFLMALKTWDHFGKGWEARCNNGHKLALSMVEKPTPIADEAKPSTWNLFKYLLFSKKGN